MRKRSKYRPKGVILDPVGYVLEGMEPVASHGSYLLDLRIKNHAAMTALTRGKATRADMDKLISMVNVSEALHRKGFGTDYTEILRVGMDALYDVNRRGAPTNKFILKAAEMHALNSLMELHDAQMDVVTVKDIEQALVLVQRELQAKKVRFIVHKDEEKSK